MEWYKGMKKRGREVLGVNFTGRSCELKERKSNANAYEKGKTAMGSFVFTVKQKKQVLSFFFFTVKQNATVLP